MRCTYEEEPIEAKTEPTMPQPLAPLGAPVGEGAPTPKKPLTGLVDFLLKPNIHDGLITVAHCDFCTRPVIEDDTETVYIKITYDSGRKTFDALGCKSCRITPTVKQELVCCKKCAKAVKNHYGAIIAKHREKIAK